MGVVRVRARRTFKDDSGKKELSEANKAVSTLATQLRLVQAAALLASEGFSRATASEIAFRAKEEYGVEVLASVAGQAFSALGLRTTTTHGKSRLVLELGDLLQLQQQLETQVEDSAPRFEAAVAKFRDVAERVGELELQLSHVADLVAKERGIDEYLQRNSGVSRELRSKQASYGYLQGQVNDLNRLKVQCDTLSTALEAAPVLEKRLKDLEVAKEGLESRSREVAKEERSLAQQKRSLGQRAEEMEKLIRVISMTKLDIVMEQAQVELVEIEKKLGKRRCLWEDLKDRWRRRGKQVD